MENTFALLLRHCGRAQQEAFQVNADQIKQSYEKRSCRNIALPLGGTNIIPLALDRRTVGFWYRVFTQGTIEDNLTNHLPGWDMTFYSWTYSAADDFTKPGLDERWSSPGNYYFFWLIRKTNLFLQGNRMIPVKPIDDKYSEWLFKASPTMVDNSRVSDINENTDWFQRCNVETFSSENLEKIGSRWDRSRKNLVYNHTQKTAATRKAWSVEKDKCGNSLCAVADPLVTCFYCPMEWRIYSG